VSCNSHSSIARFEDCLGSVGYREQARAHKLNEIPPIISKQPLHPNVSVKDGMNAAYTAIPVVTPIDDIRLAISLYFKKYLLITVIKAT
jgi:hypothetical protein